MQRQYQYVEAFQLRAKFLTLILPCSRYLLILGLSWSIFIYSLVTYETNTREPYTVLEHYWQLNKLLQTEEVAQRCSVKKVFFNISQNSQENTNAEISSYKPAIDFFLWILQNLRKTCFENICEWVLLFFVTIICTNFQKTFFPKNASKIF